MPYQVFTSYAVADRTGAMERFMKAFSEAARRVLGGDKNTTHVFHDYLNILEGTEWKPVLTAAACEASMVVFLISPTFFLRSWCGRELEAFHRRFEDWKKSVGKEERARVPLLFPIVWEPENYRPIPKKLADIQFFGNVELKVDEGSGLVDLVQSGSEAQVDQFVTRLARAIRKSRNSGHSLPLLKLDSLEQIPSAFEEVSLPYDVHLWIASEELSGSKIVANTYQTLPDLLEDGAADAQGLVLRLGRKDDGATKWAEIEAKKQILVVVAAVHQPPDEKIQALNKLPIPPAQVVLLLLDINVQNNGIPRPVGTWLQDLSEKGCLHAAHEARFAASALWDQSARSTLESLVSAARQTLIKRDKAAKVVDPKLEDVARQAGIDTAQKSTL